MPSSSNWKSWLFSAIILILVVAAGYLTVDGVLSQNDLEKKLADVQQALGALQPTEEAGGAALANPAPNPTEEQQEEEGEAGSAAPAPTPTPGVAVPYPGTDDTLVLSDAYPEVQVALTSTLPEDLDVVVRLVIGDGKSGDAPIGRRLTAEVGVNLPAGGAANATLSFRSDDLPAAGMYQGWLTVATKDDAVPGAPLSRKVIVAVVRPALAVASRVANASEPMTITLSGVRPWPCKSSTVQWASHTLRLWERELLPAQYRFLASELVNQEGGYAGKLAAVGCIGSVAASGECGVSLRVEDITYPGEYKGTLAMYADDGRVSRVVDVVARARDGLVWPALLIFFGALLLGWLMRVSLGDSLKSVPVLRHRTRLARKRLKVARTWSPVSVKCSEVERDLSAASVALDVHDVARAVNNLQAAETCLDELEKAWNVLAAITAHLKAVAGDPAKTEQAEKALSEASDNYLLGNLSKVYEALAKLHRLDGDRAQNRSGTEAAEVEGVVSLKSEGERPEFRWEKDGLHPSRPQKTAEGVLILYSDEACTFSLVQPAEGTLVPAKWTCDGLADGVEGSKYPIVVAADPNKTDPRRHTLTATTKCGDTYKLPLEVRLPYLVQQPGDLVAGDSLTLRAIPSPGVEEPLGTWSWEVRRRKSGEFEPVSSTFVVKRGRYQVAGKLADRLVAFGKIAVARDPAVVSRLLLRYQAQLATILVAIIATIAGLVYIDSRVPTFGSPGDYLLALAWAFGLSGAVAPKQDLVEAILNALGKSSTVSELVKVPDLKGKTLAEAKDAVGSDLALKTDPEKAEASLIVDKQEPAAGEQKPKGSTITLTLKPPDSPVKVPDLKGKTLAQAKDAVGGNFVPKAVPETPDPTWIVEKQHPPAGEDRAKGSIITLTFKQPG